MNVVTMNAEVISGPKTCATSNGTAKATFLIQTDGGDLPLRFNVLTLGSTAQSAAELMEGDLVMLTGKMVASAKSRTMTFIANAIEILTETEQENDPHEHKTAAAS